MTLIDPQRIISYAQGLLRQHDADPGAHGLDAAWTSYTPTLTATTTNPTLGTGSAVYGRYRQIGKVVHFQIRIQCGSSPSVGSGEYRFSLPVAASASMANTQGFGSGYIYDSVGTMAVATYATATTIVLLGNGQATNCSSGIFNVQAGRIYTIFGTYEAA